MPTLRVSVRQSDEVDAEVLRSTYGAFITLRFGNDLSVYLAGHDGDSANEARKVAAALVKAADLVDAQVALTEAV